MTHLNIKYSFLKTEWILKLFNMYIEERKQSESERERERGAKWETREIEKVV